MPEVAAQVDIPKRALFKAAEVCDIVKVQPYVLRSWEAEFPDLGVSKTMGGPRLYRRADVEQVLRIKHLLLVEGLTLAGARRKLEEETSPVGVDLPEIDELMGEHARERLTLVKRGLQSILDLLANGSARPARSNGDFRLEPPAALRTKAPTASNVSRGKSPLRGKTSSAKQPARRRH
jgi:DNA-binding transcriptional MerR regulator